MNLPNTVRRRGAALLGAAALLTGLALPPAAAVTLTGDTVPHLWHSFHTPDNAFLGVAGYNGAPWNNTDVGALYVEWGGFVPATRGSWTFETPTVGSNGFTRATLSEISGSGLLTGVGNIYGLAFGLVPGPPLVFVLSVDDISGIAYTSSHTRTVVMRSGTKGTLPDMNVLLNGVPPTAAVNTLRVDGSIDMPTGPGGALEPNVTSDAEWLWRWENVPAATSYRFNFQAQVGHMSLDNLVVYMSPPQLPAPTGPTATRRLTAVGATSGLVSQLEALVATQVPLTADLGSALNTRRRSR